MTGHLTLRKLVGSRVEVLTLDGHVVGTLVSASRQSVWLVEGDDDRVIPLDRAVAVTAIAI